MEEKYGWGSVEDRVHGISQTGDGPQLPGKQETPMQDVSWARTAMQVQGCKSPHGIEKPRLAGEAWLRVH